MHRSKNSPLPTAPTMAASSEDTRFLNITRELALRTRLAIENLVIGADDSADSHLSALVNCWMCGLFECWEIGLDLVASYPCLHYAVTRVSSIWMGESRCWPSILLPPAIPGPHDVERLLGSLMVLDCVLHTNPPQGVNTS
jgi:hypothetical protein